jgi:hypothetical protein
MALPSGVSQTADLDIDELLQDIEAPLNEPPSVDEPGLSSVDPEDVEIDL